ncbi:rRNA-binding ribosome biosynthesis protein utp25 [Bachmanniomyces sp. S44760]|nr:rRNA-binding ribosome biosynthesis protein utp25 [Bachmanniomyces sp. S44760]
MPADGAERDIEEAGTEEESTIGQVSDRISDVSSSDQETSNSNIVNPYATLLQTLSANVQRGQPERKRRKIDYAKDAEVVSTIEATEEAEVKADRQDANEDIDDQLTEEFDEDEDLPPAEADLMDVLQDNDPFDSHFANPDAVTLNQHIEFIKDTKWTTRKLSSDRDWKQVLTEPIDSSGVRSSVSIPAGLQDLHVKHKLEAPAARLLPNLNGLYRVLASSIFNYQDLIFSERTSSNEKGIREMLCLHTLNHVFKTRDRIIKNNARLSREPDGQDVELRDQGFTRSKVLILLPTRQSCVRYIQTLTELCEPEQQENRKRFNDSYVQIEEQFSDDKPDDFRELFAGNDDDMFRLGVKFTRKTIKYFSQFYNSDMIFASPLGLRRAMDASSGKKEDMDFLSSIEIVILDQTDAIFMQNWEHAEHIFQHLNLQPKEAHGCDFSRVRNWYLDGNAKYRRQSILISAYNCPEFNNLYSRSMLNTAGKLKISKAHQDGAMLHLNIQVRQTFSRIDVMNLNSDPDIRFKYFSTTILPILAKAAKGASSHGHGVLIFIPSYMDFVRVRNHLANSTEAQNISFGSISEYTPVREVARARSHFYSGRHSVLLYTSRAHHFRRYRLRGIKQVVFYALPDNPIFYKEIAGDYLAQSVADGGLDPMQASVRIIFSRWDYLKLERIVGSSRVAAMLKEKGSDTFDFT